MVAVVVIASATTPLPGVGSVVIALLESLDCAVELVYTDTHAPALTCMLYNAYPLAATTVAVAAAVDAKLAVVVATVARELNVAVVALITPLVIVIVVPSTLTAPN